MDDPIVAISGDLEDRRLSLDMLLTFWLTLGIPLSWSKGRLGDAASLYTWIGVQFQLRPDGFAELSLPGDFTNNLVELLDRVRSGTGMLSIKEAQTLIGRAGRVAQVLPATQPWVSGLFAAFNSAMFAQHSGCRECRPGFLSCRRFASSARFLHKLLLLDNETLFDIKQIVGRPVPPPRPHDLRIEFDASIWGGGAILFEDDNPVEWFALKWSPEMLWVSYPKEPWRNPVEIGSARFQTFWEFFTLYLSLAAWAIPNFNMAVLGDNTASLQRALDKKGTLTMLKISSEIALHQLHHQWLYSVGHLPAESNVLADILSRLYAPDAKIFPSILTDVTEFKFQDYSSLWTVDG